jgi:hypothetical protein
MARRGHPRASATSSRVDEGNNAVQPSDTEMTDAFGSQSNVHNPRSEVNSPKTEEEPDVDVEPSASKRLKTTGNLFEDTI